MARRPQLFDLLKTEDYFAGRSRKKQSGRRQLALMVAREVIRALDARARRNRPPKEPEMVRYQGILVAPRMKRFLETGDLKELDKPEPKRKPKAKNHAR